MGTLAILIGWISVIFFMVYCTDKWSKWLKKKKRTKRSGGLVVVNPAVKPVDKKKCDRFCSQLQKLYTDVNRYSRICYNHLCSESYGEAEAKNIISELSFQANPEKVDSVINRWKEFHGQVLNYLYDVNAETAGELQDINNEIIFDLTKMKGILSKK